MKAADVKSLGVGVALLVGTAAVVLAARWLYQNRERFNPASDKNFAYSGVNAVGAVVAEDPYWTLGGAIYDGVDKVQDWLPFVESDAERSGRLARQALEKKKPAPELTPESGAWEYYAP